VGQYLGPTHEFPPNTLVDAIRPLLERHQGVLVKRSKELVGIISRSDLLKTIC